MGSYVVKARIASCREQCGCIELCPDSAKSYRQDLAGCLLMPTKLTPYESDSELCVSTACPILHSIHKEQLDGALALKLVEFQAQQP